jgi:peptidoglycan/xylan/chitin deacetylase (PgdA/CDA1 family)
MREIGAPEGLDAISYPDTSDWRSAIISFREHEITDIILKRPETASFSITAPFSHESLKGEIICEISDGIPAITLDDGALRFLFDPFKMHLANLGEGFPSSGMSRTRRFALSLYWQAPGSLRRGIRWVGRRYKTPHIKSLRDLQLVGASSNVIMHLIQRHLLGNGMAKMGNNEPYAFVTHDIDTEFCQTEGSEIVAGIEKDVGVRSTWFFVPKSVQYRLNRKSVSKLSDEEHEIGMHGYSHDGKLALENSQMLADQLRKGKTALESLVEEVVSFRSPWTLRSNTLLAALASQGFKVDSSFPDLDELGMTGGRRGVFYNRPFRPMYIAHGNLLETHQIWEVPITGPQDVQMIEDLALMDDDLLKVWKYKAEFCRDFGGAFVLHTHPIHIVKRLDCYSKILKYLTSSGFKTLRLADFNPKGTPHS